MELLRNPFRGSGLPARAGPVRGRFGTDPSEARALLRRCPAASATPLRDMPGLASPLGVEALFLKDESRRMGLGSFKALGAAYVIARQAARLADGPDGPATAERMAEALRGRVYVCASAGNHGLSVAAGARAFGATAVIYLAESVPEPFAERLRRFGAEVVRAGADYEASMAAAAAAAEENGWFLLSDSSWPGYTEVPARVMEGYLVAGDEVTEAFGTPPGHIFLQAGVGGLAASMTALFRARWGDGPTVVVVEPRAGRPLTESIRAGAPVRADGPASVMGRLDCKEPSHLALAELARGADWFVTLEDHESEAAVDLLRGHGIATTPSGAAGVAALQHADGHREALGLSGRSRVLAFISEGRENAG